MHLSFLQKFEPFIFLSLEIWTLETEICLETECVFKFDSLEACKGKKVAIGTALNITKIQIFMLRKI